MARDLDQERAAQAWKDVQQRKDSEYKNAAKAAPSMIMNNGLMQTLAFLYQKNESQKLLSKQISTWILRQIFGEQSSQAKEDPFLKVMAKLHQTESSITYRRATEEALSYLRWVRQFAPALIGD